MSTRISFVAGMVLAAAAAAQVPGPPPLRGVYFRSPSGWVGLPINTLLPFENGTARWLLGFGRGDAIAEAAGPHAAFQTSNARPTFYLRGFPPTSGIYMIREIQKQDYREIHMPVSGNFREWAHFRKQDLIDTDTRHGDGDVMLFSPRADLKPGEYAIVSVLEPSIRNIRVSFDFGVSQLRDPGNLAADQR